MYMDQYMDSLDIPMDLIWEGKLEPLSPSQLALAAANVEDILYFENDFTANLLPEELFESTILPTSSILSSNFNSSKSAEALLFEIQADMIEAQKDTEQWSNQPVNISSMLNNYPLNSSFSSSLSSVSQPSQPQPQQLPSQIRNHVHHQSTVKIENTAQLLKEFDNVLNGIAQLTPPQSPPLSPGSIIHVAETALSTTTTATGVNQTSGYHHPNDYNNYNHNNNNNNNDYDQQSAYFYQQNPIVSTNKYQPIEIIPSEQQQQHQYNNNSIESPIYFGDEYNNGVSIQSSYASSLASPTATAIAAGGSSPITDPSDECDELNEVYEMEVVDELIRARSQNLPDWAAIITSSPSLLPPLNDTENNESINKKFVVVATATAAAAAATNNANEIIMDDDFESIASNSSLSPRSESSYSSSNDDEWKPNRILSTKTTKKSSSNAKPSIDDEDDNDEDDVDDVVDSGDDTDSIHSSSITSKTSTTLKTITKKRRPYKRSKEDLKSRKKEQNKNAATRYRIKKKAEIEIILDEEQKLQQICDGLQVKYVNVRREIKYLKGLMRDIFIAKGIM